MGTGRQTSLAEVVETARSVLPIRAEPRWGSMAARSWDTSSWRADSARIRQELGWRPRHSLRQGLERMVRWFQEHDDMRRQYEAAQAAALRTGSGDGATEVAPVRGRRAGPLSRW